MIATERLARIAAASLMPSLIEIYLELYDSSDDVEPVYDSIERLVESIGDPAIPVLLRSLLDEDPRVRAAAIDMLRMLGPTADLRVLRGLRAILMIEQNEMVYDAAVWTLAAVGDRKALPMLLEHVHEPRYARAVVAALGRLRDRTTLPLLARMLSERPHTVSVGDVMRALERFDTAEAQLLIDGWLRSDAGQDYIEERVDMAMQALLLLE
ncbi:MAG: HEAT repeat domain-containing protein [Anaerolineae bacterium]